MSAASGLVCAHGRAYVIADDEHHLAVFNDLHSPGQLHRFAAGDLPHSKAARKRCKLDMETLLLLADSRLGEGGALLALGSGSRPNRQTGVLIALSGTGTLSTHVVPIDLAPLYRSLRAHLGALNIEGALVANEELLLLNRGTSDGTGNSTARFKLADVYSLLAGQPRNLEPCTMRHYELGDIAGVSLGFTDGAAIAGGGWVFTAVAEDTDDSVADGPCAGSAVGMVDERGDLLAVRRLKSAAKVEGIDARISERGIDLCLVTDFDDPTQSSWLLQARLRSVFAS